MVSPTNPNDDDFYARALASFNQQMAIANNNSVATKEVEQYAKSLVNDDHPKIDAAVKSYLSLVAARSAVASDIDVLPDSTSRKDIVQCTFATSSKSPIDANRCSLMCARTLLSAINSTTIPTDFEKGVDTSTINEDEEVINNEEEKMKTYMQDNTTKILWNRLVVQSSSSTGDKEKAKQTKPSKILGRKSLLVAYPYIQERFRRGTLLSEEGGKDDTTSPSVAVKDETNTNNPLRLLPNDVLPPISPPKGIETDQWKAFYTEFGQLLYRACINDENEDTEEQTKAEQHDDSALIWSSDKGKSELQSRRESRAKRASNALSSVEDAKTTITEALGGDGETKDNKHGETK